jgi:hypothetical protein
MPAITERTLSEADYAAIRSLYGSGEKVGSIKGRIQNSVDGNLLPVTAGHVWIEDLASGRVVASGLTSAGGKFSVSGVPEGEYRALVEYLDANGVDSAALTGAAFTTTAALNFSIDRKPGLRQRAFRSVEIASRLRVTADQPTPLNYVLVPPQNSAPALNPRFFGINGELSTVPVSAGRGNKLTIYIAGEGVDQIPGSGLVFSSPFLLVDQTSLSLQQSRGSTSVISFSVTVAENAPAGDYSIRLQANSGETAYLVGGIKVNSNK